MERPLLVVVTGPPAAGKTTIARELAARLGRPLIAKDTIKEALFDRLGTGDLAWSSRLGEATYLAMQALVVDSVAAGASLVLEGNLVRRSGLEAALTSPPARFFQVHCSAPLALLIERYNNRIRHPGHIDADRAEALEEAVNTGRHDPLDLPGETIRIDTSQPVDIDAVVGRIAAGN
jgi:predicted kinase